jgi:hypothetical protein
MTRESALAEKYYREQDKRISEELKQGAEIRRADLVGAAAKTEIGPALDSEIVEQLIFELDGNVSAIAKALSVRSDRLRAFIMAKGELRRALDEVYEGAVDESIGVLFKGLRDEASFQNRFYAAKEFLRSGAGHKRGFGQAPAPMSSLEIKDSAAGRTIVLKWLEPDALAPPTTIEGEKA